MTDLSTHPTQMASAWLADFTTVLERQDVDAAVALFAPDTLFLNATARAAFTGARVGLQHGLQLKTARIAA